MIKCFDIQYKLINRLSHLLPIRNLNEGGMGKFHTDSERKDFWLCLLSKATHERTVVEKTFRYSSCSGQVQTVVTRDGEQRSERATTTHVVLLAGSVKASDVRSCNGDDRG